MWIAFIRHAETDWNRHGRLQGRIDRPLHSAAKRHLARQRISTDLQRAHWVASPLQRAQQTAVALCGRPVDRVAALIETDWGDYEGLPLCELSARIQQDQLMPARGLDMRPPRGESARMVCARLHHWLGQHARQQNTVAVTHKGVLRAALSLATGWDMHAPYPLRIDWQLPQLFALERAAQGAQLRVLKLNLDWQEEIDWVVIGDR